jgi:hypothetical protein
MRSRTEGISVRRQDESPANRISFDIHHTLNELLFRHDLALIEAAHPHTQLVFPAKGEAALDELHGLFQRNVWGRRDQSVEMVGHDDKGMQQESSLTAVIEESLLQQFRSGGDLEDTAALCRHSGYEIRTSFLWRDPHLGRINERPVAKAILVEACAQGPERPLLPPPGRRINRGQLTTNPEITTQSSSRQACHLSAAP